MKALIVVHDNHQESNVFPLGAAYIASSLMISEVDVETFCMDVFHQTNQDLSELILNKSFDIILLGFMAPRFRRTVRELCLTIDKARGVESFFILGGYGPSAMPEYVIQETGADIVCVGEADYTITSIVNAIKGGNSRAEIQGLLSEINGIVYKNSFGSVITNDRAPKIKKLDDLPLPRWDLFPMDIYTTNLKFAGMGSDERSFPIISSRGCTDRCTFCFRLETGIRWRSPENVINEMKILNLKYGVTYFYFVDELAIVSRKQILRLTSEIKKSLPGIHYRMDCRVTLFDDEIAKALKDSGCVFLNMGFESTDQNVLDQMNKRVDVNQNAKTMEIAIKYKIGTGINFIWGMPGDNEKTLRSNAEFIKKYNQYDQVRTIRPVTPYPGSPLYDVAVSQGHLSGPGDFFDKFTNSDRYMVNFMGIPEQDIYEMLLDVNTDLIYDHFKNTNKDSTKAEEMIAALTNVYKNENFLFTGLKDTGDNSALKSKYAGM